MISRQAEVFSSLYLPSTTVKTLTFNCVDQILKCECHKEGCGVIFSFIAASFLYPLRERVQISASIPTDSDQSVSDFFRFR